MILLLVLMLLLAPLAIVARVRRRQRPHAATRYYLASLALIVLFAISPLISMMLAGFVARAAGCILNEAEVHRCIIHGHDYGETLYGMGMGIWFTMFTVPLAEVALLLWAIVLIVHLVLHRRRRNSRTI